jgi:hypothetical protein
MPDLAVDADRWRRAAQALIPTPAPYRRHSVGAREARQLLRCDDDALAELAAAGLAAEDAGEARFDYYDLMNLGLLAGTGRSLPELGERSTMQLARGSRADWSAEYTWHLRVEATCSQPRCPDPPAPTRPCPEEYGGRCTGWEPGDGGRWTAATVTLRGAGGEVAAPAAREAYAEVVEALADGRWVYAWLPPGLRADWRAAVANRTLDCVTTSLLVQQRCLDAGLTARTRSGVILGLVGVAHAWAEVREEGGWRVLDPLLAHLAGRHPASSPDFAAFCRGHLGNRVLPWARAADEPVVPHDCPLGGRPTLATRLLGPAGPADSPRPSSGSE